MTPTERGGRLAVTLFRDGESQVVSSLMYLTPPVGAVYYMWALTLRLRGDGPSKRFLYSTITTANVVGLITIYVRHVGYYKLPPNGSFSFPSSSSP